MDTKIKIKDIQMGPLVYEGKAKKVFSALDGSGQVIPDWVIIHYKDAATAFNGEKKGQIEDKGRVNNKITAAIFKLLEKAGIPTHFVARISERDMLCKRLSIVPLEVIVRNIAAGSMAKRLGLTEGAALRATVFELSYKDDTLGDPLINEYHAAAIGAATFEEIETIKALTFKINTLLIDFFQVHGIKLIDFKLEFGKTPDGKLVLADEISPDTCRLWDLQTNKKLDKDRFRQDLGDVKEAYIEVLNRLGADA
ncbi:phosphoribosylaminoimidazolesuccinocarboxamide synthase [Breznakiellaceae bacterium SP9]